MKKIKILNEEYTFDFKNLFYYKFDIGTVTSSQVTSKSVNQDGYSLENTTYGTRGIIIEGLYKSEPEKVKIVKEKMARLVNPKIPITIIIGNKQLTAYPTTSINFNRESFWNNDNFFRFLIEATAYDPFLYDLKEKTILTQGFEDLFEFELEIPKEGIEFARKRDSLIKVENNGVVPTGVIFEYHFIGDVSKPKIINAISREYIQLNYDFKSGDRLIIDTNFANKKITLTRDGQTSNILRYLDYRSSFLQMQTGINEFKFEVESGEDSYQSIIRFKERWFE